MRKYIDIVLMVSMPILFLASCNGGDGKGEEFTVYDVRIDIQELFNEEVATDCPQSANIKLSLHENKNNIYGFAELIGFGNIGEPSDVSGSIQDSNFSLNPFSTYVSGGLTPTDIPRPIYLDLSIAVFDGTFLDDDGEKDGLKIEGIVSGDISYSVTGGPDCIASFTGEFSGQERSPQGCVSRIEVPTLECPAEGFVNQCDQYDYYFCPGFCEPNDGGQICVDFGFNASECEVIDCVTLSCPSVGTIHLEEGGGFMFGGGDHILHCG